MAEDRDEIKGCLAELEIAQSVSKTNDAGYQDAVGGVVRDDAGDASVARVLESSDSKRSGMRHLQAYSCVDASLLPRADSSDRANRS